MLVFRSEAEVDRWCERRAITRGAVMNLELIWSLAQPWYGGRADAGWRGRPVEQAQAVVDSIGLAGNFWNFSGEETR